ncbi:MAG: hypothetical protein LBJ75_01870 [Puniceicoccales bacterium]|nr:hypothetical protein [Puniceicoccales bacterium]
MRYLGQKTFGLLIATIGCLFFNSNLRAVDEMLLVGTMGASSVVILGEFPTVTVNNLLTNALSNRMTNVNDKCQRLPWGSICPCHLWAYTPE